MLRPTPLRGWSIPLQMAQKDVFTTDLSTRWQQRLRELVDSQPMAQLAPVAVDAAHRPAPEPRGRGVGSRRDDALARARSAPSARSSTRATSTGSRTRRSTAPRSRSTRRASRSTRSRSPTSSRSAASSRTSAAASACTSSRPSSPRRANASHYARIVRETATLRGLIRAGGEISRLGWDRPGEAGDLVDQAEQIIFDLSQQRVTRRVHAHRRSC